MHLNHNALLSKDIIPQERGEVKTKKPEIKVVIHFPGKVSATARRQKVNRIYKILSGMSE